MNAINTSDNILRVWKLAKSIEVGMLTTTGSAGMHSRPLQALFDKESGSIWFIVNRNSAKVPEVEEHSAAQLTFSDPSKGEHVVMKGKVEMNDDRARLKKLWSSGADIFFPKGPTDPDATLVRFQPEFAEFWSGGSGVMAFAVHLVEAKLTGRTPEVGDHAKVAL